MLARVQLEPVSWTAAAATSHHRGPAGATRPGCDLAPYGLDLQHLHFQCPLRGRQVGSRAGAGRRLPGPGHQPARGLPVRDGAVHRRGPRQPGGRGAAGLARAVLVGRRLRPRSSARGLLAEHALWRGDTEPGAGRGPDARSTATPPWSAFSPAVIRPAAIALSARADRARHARATGDDRSPVAELAAAEELLRHRPRGARRPRAAQVDAWALRAAAGWPAPRPSTSGPRAATTRRPGRRSLDAFGPALRLRDSPHPVAAGRGAGRGGPPGRGRAAVAAGRAARRTGCGPAPLRRALEDLGRRARIGHGARRPAGRRAARRR